MLLVHIFSFDFFLFLFHLSGITVFYFNLSVSLWSFMKILVYILRSPALFHFSG
ncbi:hypothetical protein M119_1226 [Bacteroides fragilis str. 3783N1-6]|uniref:Transmembrane protein n=1 Tax=Bacteroides fragilis str. 3783N1-6 TaxID=1339310 RepID=A0AB73AQC6_BACFG|nr:hypothetical protein M118_0998 [Bacteroides fragilis str. 3783N1-2]EXY52116.1 hypothetical protein M121_1053 [Bacteroides fragilis str. 3783N2-1]EXY56907.1 hypothetical protein M122_1005 [Bacteroides fragilis str. 3976T7]EXZ69178.1 hypothetical protein M120_1427 [Bacteroides fragilis str. 3783N1-8]EYB10689.1 hypothetical protein M119_1226 [Bacteroides fragilis str. 3783N1-6]